MISGLARRPGTPKMFRILLVGFILRNLLSVVVLAYLTYLSYVAGARMRYLMLALLIGFTGFAIYQGWKIFGQYRRSLRRAASADGGKRR